MTEPSPVPPRVAGTRQELIDELAGYSWNAPAPVPVTATYAAARDRWYQLNELIGEASPGGCRRRGVPLDRARLAELLGARAQCWLQLGQAIDDDADPRVHVYAIACHYAAELDQRDAARHRYAGGIPSLFPRAELELLQLRQRTCSECGRPWQVDPAGACDQCPRLMFGHPLAEPSTWQLVDPAELADPVPIDD